ncbi:MAG: TIGR01620 family protein [gamma proteobacterium symbiont of Taylorina sp.]|nr:TIGR01620 family protein [gamma proteobacterium symbiont of Taylorina sp.]
MTTKPFKVIIDNNSKEDTIDPPIAPRTFEPDPELDKIITTIDEVGAGSIENSGFYKIIQLLGSLSGIFLSLILFVFISLFAHTIDNLSNLFQSARLSDYLYISGLLVFLSALAMNIISNLKQLRQLQAVSRLKQRFNKQQKNPTDDTLILSNELLLYFKKNKVTEFHEHFDETKQKINTTQNYCEIYDILDNILLAPLDEKARVLIHKASLQAAFSTAISPIPLIDMIIIIWRSLKLATDISKLYGYRTGGLTSVLLLKQGVINVIFAGVSELTLQLTNEITSASVVHKISHSAGQGIANGILLTRLGYGILDACRPLKLSGKRENIAKSIVESLKNSFKTKEETIV